MLKPASCWNHRKLNRYLPGHGKMNMRLFSLKYPQPPCKCNDCFVARSSYLFATTPRTLSLLHTKWQKQTIHSPETSRDLQRLIIQTLQVSNSAPTSSDCCGPSWSSICLPRPIPCKTWPSNSFNLQRKPHAITYHHPSPTTLPVSWLLMSS